MTVLLVLAIAAVTQVVAVMVVSLTIGSVVAVTACPTGSLCWTQRTIEVTVKDSFGVSPVGNIKVDVYKGCCTEATYTVTNLSDKTISVCIVQVDGLPAGITATLSGGPVVLVAGQSKSVVVTICAACDAQSGNITFKFASNICAPCLSPCPTGDCLD
jgi:hypothetical protein